MMAAHLFPAVFVRDRNRRWTLRTTHQNDQFQKWSGLRATSAQLSYFHIESTVFRVHFHPKFECLAVTVYDRSRPRILHLYQIVFIEIRDSKERNSQLMLTWCLSVVAKIRDKQRLSINDDNIIRGHFMNSLKRTDFLWPREFEVFWNRNIAKVNAEIVTPHRKPFNVTQCFAVGQR